MQLVVEIDDTFLDLKKKQNRTEVDNAILNGTPLSYVIEDIKAEIEKAKWCDKDTRLVKNCNASGLEVALEIIDKHIGKEEGAE